MPYARDDAGNDRFQFLVILLIPVSTRFQLLHLMPSSSVALRDQLVMLAELRWRELRSERSQLVEHIEQEIFLSLSFVTINRFKRKERQGTEDVRNGKDCEQVKDETIAVVCSNCASGASAYKKAESHENSQSLALLCCTITFAMRGSCFSSSHHSTRRTLPAVFFNAD